MSREKKLKAKLRGQSRLMVKAANVLNTATANNDLLQERNNFWRNLLCASAFARGLGNERPISEVVEECVPTLLGINRPQVPGQVAP